MSLSFGSAAAFVCCLETLVFNRALASVKLQLNSSASFFPSPTGKDAVTCITRKWMIQQTPAGRGKYTLAGKRDISGESHGMGGRPWSRSGS